MPKALVIRTAGTNCDAERCRAVQTAGAEVDLVLLDRLIAEPARVAGFDLFGFPGGFSYGDDIASGRIFAMKVRERLYPALRDVLDDGALVIGACNGFQTLVQAGLLPGPSDGGSSPAERGGWPERPPAQTVALTDNQDHRFSDRWVPVEYVAGSVCVWTRGLAESALADPALAVQTHVLPVAHGEGRFVAATPDVLAELDRRRGVVVRYKDNYNGSQGSVAGICDASGRVFALMPHPERFLDWNRHPSWTRMDPAVRKGVPPGLQIFRNAVEATAGTTV
jgi:phosphoribosylformylglycinamidine synthase